MGRVTMPIDLFEIVSLVWDHPLIVGLFILMLTPPMFPVLVFFSPLLISTALCAVALISVGEQSEDPSKGNGAGGDDGEIFPAAAYRESRAIRRRRGIPGEDNWLDWVRGDMEPGSVWGQTESSMFIEDVKEENLLADFRVDGGGIDMKEEDYHRQQVREFEGRNLGERSFSFRTGAVLAAKTLGGSPDRDSSMSLIPFQNNNNPTSTFAPAAQIPPMFHYPLTGGTNFMGAVPVGQRPPHTRRPQEEQPPKSGIQQQQKTSLSFGDGFLSGNFEQPVNAVRPQPDHQQRKSLASFGSGFFSFNVDEPKKENELETRSKQQQQHPPPKQLVSFGSGFFSDVHVEPEEENRRQAQHDANSAGVRGSIGMPESVDRHQKGWHHHWRSVPPSPDLRQRGSIFEFRRDRGADKGDGIDSTWDRKAKAASNERFKANTYNAGLIPGNAVIYTAEPAPVDTRQLQRDSLADRQRAGSTSTSRQKRNGMAARHALLVEKENTVMPFSLRRK
ncbi:hypothetical protein R1sor_002532 [Riccia sorocarpa]|uniref:Uncharacterized protein n=1 Tax=Riccia sorocarpa TaxID=122646 RepID=A0ABD3GZ38_9MARC